MTIPNQLTVLRIMLIPVFVLVFYLPYSGANVLACIVFFIAALTDLFDGYLARKLNQTSAFGEFLDPVADKLIVVIALILLIELTAKTYMTLPAAVIIGREIAVSALREWMAEIGARSKVSVSFLGKIKTVIQMIAVGLLILNEPVLGLPIYAIGLILLYIAALLTLASMVEYLTAAWPKLKE